jgi:hypothetical protein
MNAMASQEERHRTALSRSITDDSAGNRVARMAVAS